MNKSTKRSKSPYAAYYRYCFYYPYWSGRRVIGISSSLIWSKTLMKLIFNPCGEFRWSTEGPVNQIHSPHLHVGAPGIFSHLLRSVQMLKRCGKQREASAPTQSLVKLQPWFLSLRWKTCLRQNCRVKDLPFGRTLIWYVILTESGCMV